MANSNVAYQFPRVRKSKTPESVQKILTSALSKFGLDKDIARYQFVLHWKDIVGEDIAQRTRPECFRNGALVVRVKDSSWAQELSFQKEVILKKLRNFISSDLKVDDVQFYVGDIR